MNTEIHIVLYKVQCLNYHQVNSYIWRLYRDVIIESNIVKSLTISYSIQKTKANQILSIVKTKLTRSWA